MPQTEGAAPSAAPSPYAIYISSLTKRYRTTTALTGLTMAVPRGEVFGFLGPNGAGKTTAVKLLLGLTKPSSGEAWILGQPIGSPNARRHVGYLPELFRYQEWLAAREVVAVHCGLLHLPRQRWNAESERVLTLVGLQERARDRVGTFSKGMQQRLGLAVALLGQPELVLLDEPTSALDPVGRHDVREIIRSLRQQGTTVFLNSHLLSEVESVCDRVAVINKGELIASGTLESVIGAVQSVRLRLEQMTAESQARLARWGTLTVEGAWYSVAGLELAHVPDLVAELVHLGVRIHAVEPRQLSLEDRFLELLGGANVTSPAHR